MTIECSKCGKRWEMESFLKDLEVNPVGMLVRKNALEESFFFFTHESGECNTTFAMTLDLFVNHVDGSLDKEGLIGTNVCHQKCRRIENLSTCDNDCRFSAFREFFIQLKEQREKGGHDWRV